MTDATPEPRITCPACGWTGLRPETNYDYCKVLNCVFYECPRCRTNLDSVVSAALMADPAYRKQREEMNQRDEFRDALHARFEAPQLTDPNRLPSLPGDEIVLTIDAVPHPQVAGHPDSWYDGATDLVVLHGNNEIWRESLHIGWTESEQGGIDGFLYLITQRYGQQLRTINRTAAFNKTKTWNDSAF